MSDIRVAQVLESDCKTKWEIGKFVPGMEPRNDMADPTNQDKNQPGAKIVAMFQVDGAVKVYAIPVDKFGQDQNTPETLYFVFTLMWLHTKMVIEVARPSDWKKMLQLDLDPPTILECDACNTDNDEDANFCKSCGASFEGEEDKPETPSIPQINTPSNPVVATTIPTVNGQ